MENALGIGQRFAVLRCRLALRTAPHPLPLHCELHTGSTHGHAAERPCRTADLHRVARSIRLVGPFGRGREGGPFVFLYRKAQIPPARRSFGLQVEMSRQTRGRQGEATLEVAQFIAAHEQAVDGFALCVEEHHAAFVTLLRMEVIASARIHNATPLHLLAGTVNGTVAEEVHLRLDGSLPRLTVIAQVVEREALRSPVQLRTGKILYVAVWLVRRVQFHLALRIGVVHLQPGEFPVLA